MLFFRAGSIWVAWFIENILSGEVSNLWTLKEKQTHSSTTKQILRVRDLVYNWIKIVPGDGRSIRFWSDNWSPFGNLRTYLQLPHNRSLGIRPNSSLRSLYDQERWLLPHPRSEEQLSLHAYLSTIALTEEADKYIWSPLGTPLNTYATGMIYKEIKNHHQIVQWHKIVWSSRSIPRHNFLTWLVVLNRCATKDRMLSWGLQTDPMYGMGSLILLVSEITVYIRCDLGITGQY